MLNFEIFATGRFKVRLQSGLLLGRIGVVKGVAHFIPVNSVEPFAMNNTFTTAQMKSIADFMANQERGK